MPALPEAFVERLHAILGEAAARCCLAALSRPAPVAFRVNGLRATAPAVIAELETVGLSPMPLSGFTDAFVVPPEQRERLTRSEAAVEGRIYVQNPASMVPPMILDPRPGEEVLDLAAAPGSKTLQMACLMQDRGRIAAVEVVRTRFFRLKANIARQGATCIRTYRADGAGIWRKTPERFDRVLLDAPCSSEGRMRPGEPESWAFWSERKIAEMARKQKRLLYSALRCLKPGGRLVYSTCAFAPEENEAVIDDQLRRIDGVRILPFELPFDNVQPGLTAWRGRAFHRDLTHARRILPDGLMEGFFVCLMERG